MSKATRSKDGRLRASVVVTYRLDLHELTCAAAMGWMYDDKPGVARAKAAAIARLMSCGDSPSVDYADRADEDDDLEPNYWMLKPYVARAFGFPYEEPK